MISLLLSHLCTLRLAADRTSVVVDFAGQLKGLKACAMAYSDLSVEGSAEEAAEGLFRALRWAERQPSAHRLLIAGTCRGRVGVRCFPCPTSGISVLLNNCRTL